MEVGLFDTVAALVRGMAPSDLGEFRERHHRYGIKVWFGPARPPREHYEAQVVDKKYVKGAKVLALEVGFHAEHPDEKENEAALEKLARTEKKWRRELGKEPEVGGFLGAAVWRRISETWLDPDLGEPDLAFEIAARLTDYVTALEPLRASS
jgi:sugar phosphate isomerase/epimerase